ncbi:hypothetical protein CC78DRAFT_575418 [Lojkania enalia]|uniref:Serine protease n=1 Tax=Lojkania enalia TaxID=147567 RepID=A0A9P4KIT3_9PLEO|nr:hypothetical protein CC78DRAFT_575418 [Didymosphaeria enalia]
MTENQPLRASDEPYKWICRIQTTWDDKETRGTGFLVNIPRTDVRCIVTAGHNLVRPPLNQGGQNLKPKEVKLTFVEKKESYISKPSEWNVNEIYQDHPVDDNAAYDYALIAVAEQDAKGKVFERGGFGYTIRVTEDVINHSQVSVYGYPIDMKDNEPFVPKGGRGSARVEHKRILYDINTAVGVSGGPVWISHRTGDNTVVGIHNYGKKPGKHEAYATWLTLEVLEKMLKWIKYPGSSQSVQVMFREPKGAINSDYFLCMPKKPSNSAISRCNAFSVRGTSTDATTNFAFIPIEAQSYRESTSGANQHTNIYIIRPQGSALGLASYGKNVVFAAYEPVQEQAWFTVEKLSPSREIYVIRKKRILDEKNPEYVRINCETIKKSSQVALQCPHLGPRANVDLIRTEDHPGKPDVWFEIK